MPSAQVIDFGPDPRAEALGGFTKNFLSSLNKQTEQRRNDALFKKISENYGPDTDPLDFFNDVLRSEGMDQEYKRDRLSEIKELAALSSKSKLNGFEKAKLDLRKDELGARNETNRIANVRLTNEQGKIKNQGEKAKRDLPKEIANYTAKALKDQGLGVEDIADINAYIREQMEDEENPASLDQAFKRALQFNQLQREIVDDSPFVEKAVPKTEKFFGLGGATQEEYTKSFQEAEAMLQKLHDEDGITSQKDLRKIAERGGWSKEEINKMLQNVFRRNGKKLLGPKPKGNTPQQSAQIPFQEQGRTSQVAGLDDILFGE